MIRDPVKAPSAGLPLTVRAGDTPVRLLLHLLRTRGWVLVAIVVVPAVIALVTGQWSLLLEPVALVGGVLLILVLVLVNRLLYRDATITVTETDLVVHHVRTRRLRRADVRELVVGWFTTQPGDPAALQVAVVDVAGHRRMVLPLLFWPAGGVQQVADALDVELRDAEPADDRRLRPFYVRHLFTTAFAGAFVLLAVIGAGIVLVDHVRAGDRDEAARAATAAWSRRALGPDEVPGLVDSTATAEADDLSQDGGGVYFRVEVDLTTAGPEADPAAVTAAVDAVCGFGPDLGGVALRSSVRVDTELTGTPVDATGVRARRLVDLDCADDHDPVLDEVAAAVVRPWGPHVRFVSTTSSYDGKADVFVIVDTPDDAVFADLQQRVCSAPDQPDTGPFTGVDVSHIGAGDEARDAEVDCADRDAGLRDWAGTA